VREMNGNQCHGDPTSGTEPGSDSSRPTGPLWEIRVRGHLAGDWRDWLDGLEITSLAGGDTVLRGAIVDQAALMGILYKLNRLNVTLLSLRQVESEEY
jgi:hypothetical protein